MTDAGAWAGAAVLLAVFVISWRLTGAVRRYALSRRLLDVPNERSSHVVATPRGGGVALVLAVLAALPLLGGLGALAWTAVWGALGAGTLVAAVGFADDHRPMSPRARLAGHFAAAAWALVWLGGMPPVPAFGVLWDLGWVANLLAAVYLVWVLNLTNFMDGIDAIAGVEVVTVCAAGMVLGLVASGAPVGWQLPGVLAAAALGFLLWNWPPARIFMGDVGSGFVGLMVGFISVEAGWRVPRLFWVWVILLGVFVVDATVTLLRRSARREKILRAHRSHAYQHAARRWRAHKPVALVVGVLNLCWLLPVAFFVARGALDGPLGVAIGYAPLVALALYLRAGLPTAD
jgi:Fuc2NAc and GlcNAc transferase